MEWKGRRERASLLFLAAVFRLGRQLHFLGLLLPLVFLAMLRFLSIVSMSSADVFQSWLRWDATWLHPRKLSRRILRALPSLSRSVSSVDVRD